jgi:hypothetical protein
MEGGACLDRDVERKTKDESWHQNFAVERGGMEAV